MWNIRGKLVTQYMSTLVLVKGEILAQLHFEDIYTTYTIT